MSLQHAVTLYALLCIDSFYSKLRTHILFISPLANYIIWIYNIYVYIMFVGHATYYRCIYYVTRYYSVSVFLRVPTRIHPVRFIQLNNISSPSLPISGVHSWWHTSLTTGNIFWSSYLYLSVYCSWRLFGALYLNTIFELFIFIHYYCNTLFD